MFFRKRHFLTVTLFLVIVYTNSFASLLYIPDIPTETVSGYRSSPPYGWTYKFDAGFSDLEMNVQLRILLYGYAPGSALMQTWEDGIESMWSRKFDIADGDFHYHVNFDTVFYTSPSSNIHHTIEVIQGQGSGDMLHWYTISAWGSQYNGAYAAHEAGHMFSLYDEYIGGAVDPLNPIIDNSSIMGSLDGIAYERHYQPFLDWLQPAASGRQLYLVEYDPFWINPEIPEPATFFIVGLGGLILLRKLKA
jgi:hypothetical protein